MESSVVRATASAAAFGAGVVAALALAGCSQDGSVAEKASTAIGTLSGTLPTITQTREASTEATTEAPTEESTAAETVVEAGPAATVPAAPADATPAPAPPVPAAPATTLAQTTDAPVATAAAETVAVAPTEEESSDQWLWALLLVGAALLAASAVWAFRRRQTRRVLAEQEHAVGATVASWAAQGWVIETQSTRSAVLRRHGERVAVDVDRDGSVTSRRLDGLDGLV